IKQEGRQAEKAAKRTLVSLWGRLFSDERRPGPHRRMAPFISARGHKTISEKIIPLEDRVKQIHTDGFIISSKNTEQLIVKYESAVVSDLKIIKSGIVSIKNVDEFKMGRF
ncbi:12990_t:CDS:1, partial [Ambispora leptoticha]